MATDLKQNASYSTSEALLRSFVEQCPVAVAMFDRDMRYIFASEKWLQEYRLKDRDVLGRSHYELNPWIPDHWRETHLRCLEGNIESSEEDRIEWADGTVDWSRWIVQPWYIEDGMVGGLIIYRELINDRKEAEHALRIAEFSVDNTSEFIFWLNAEGRFTFANDAACRGLNYQREELQRLRISELTVRDGQSPWPKDWQGLGEHSQRQFEAVFLTKSGNRIPTDVTLNYFEFEGKEYWCAFVRDITARKQTENVLSQQSAFFRKVIDMNPSLIFAKDRNGRFTLVNQAVADIYGSTVEEITGKSDADFNDNPDEVEHFRQDDLNVMNSKQMKFIPEEPVSSPSGDTRWFQTVKLPILDESGRATHVLGVATDITERKRMEEEQLRLAEQMRNTQKLESLGVLSGGIAHDFNNLLMGIMGNAGLALLELPETNAARRRVENIQTAATRAAELTNQLLAYSGKGQFVVEPLGLNELIAEMSKLLETVISKKANLRMSFSENLPLVKGDATQLRQIVMNLLTNASEALGEQSGEIELRTSARRFSEVDLARTYLDEQLPAGEYVLIEVSDSGCGMDEETLAKIFDPFFTTKFTGRGLGLAAVLGIVRGHQGALKVVSHPGEGTTFSIILPVTEYSPSESLTEQIEIQTGDASIEGVFLVVDDEELTRSVSSEMLKSYGFEVVTAENGRVALEIFKTRSSEFAGVLLDMTMPELSGAETFREMHKINPNVPVILTSGYSEQEAMRSIRSRDIAGFIQKPYDPTTLYEAIESMLANRL